MAAQISMQVTCSTEPALNSQQACKLSPALATQPSSLHLSLHQSNRKRDTSFVLRCALAIDLGAVELFIWAAVKRGGTCSYGTAV